VHCVACCAREVRADERCSAEHLALPMPNRPVTWVRIGDRYPDLKGELDHFLALDGEAEVGMVRFNPAGIDAGSWMWSMLLVHPGPAFRRPRSGTTPTRRAAARELLECWRAFRRWYGMDEA
jgi:hypothetical protein